MSGDRAECEYVAAYLNKTLDYVEAMVRAETEPRSCDNCASEEGYSNSSGEWQCDNCGYSETN